MNPGSTATATIELDLGTQAPTGAVTDGHGHERRFSGWIELAAAIEDWRTALLPRVYRLETASADHPAAATPDPKPDDAVGVARAPTEPPAKDMR